MSVISEDQIGAIYNPDCVRALMAMAALSPDVSAAQFEEEIRENILIYLRDRRNPSTNELHSEVKHLHDACLRRKPSAVRESLERLSPQARQQVATRWTQRFGGAFPNTMEALGSTEICDKIASICRIGGQYKVRGGRKIWQWIYYSPAPTRHFEKRAAERAFISNLKMSWLKLTGDMPPQYASREKPGPFARLAAESLRLVGAPHIDVIHLINSLAQSTDARRSNLDRD